MWIVSYPRSGNTWVRLLLEHALGFETKSAYMADRRQIVGMFGDGYLTGCQEVEVIKTHATSLPGNDDVIYILRDGRDAVASYWYFLGDWERKPAESFTEFLQLLPSSGNWWAFHVYAWLELEHPHRVLLVRYEDLHKDQERELRRILDFLGLEPIRAFSDYGVKMSFENLHAHFPTFFRSGRIGAWRETFSPEDEEFFLKHDLGYLTKLGYVREEETTMALPTRSELAGDGLSKSLIRRMIELEHALEEKEAVVQEQKRAIEAYEAHMENCQHLQITGQGQLIHRPELPRLAAALKHLFGQKDVRDEGETRQP